MSAPHPELETVRDWLRFAVSRFTAAKLHFGHGSAEAYDEAAYLLLHTLHLPLDRLEPFLDARLTMSERGEVAHVIERRVSERIPAAYLTREAWLGDCRFYVDERVIVPRSYIAELLAEGLAPWIAAPESVQKALDLCTGSGCLAILLAQHFPNADVDATDISPDALAVAQHNVADHELQERINLTRSDLFANLAGKAFDLIIANPPYVSAMVMESLPQEYRHEPELALAGGDDGLDAVRIIVNQAHLHLNPGGVLVVETGGNRPAVDAAFPRVPFIWADTPSSRDSVFVVRAEDLPAEAAVGSSAHGARSLER